MTSARGRTQNRFKEAYTMVDAHAENLTLLDGRITGFQQIPEDSGDAPLVVFVHGGGSSALETLVPGHSQLGLTAENGYPAFALNRPGYQQSESLGFPGDTDEGWFAATAERLDDAIAELWERFGSLSRGVVVHGCSIGGAISLTLASRWSATEARGETRWPLLGVAVADIGHVVPDYVRDRWLRTEVAEYVPDLRSGLSDMPTPPAWTLPSGDGPNTPARIPRDELLEIVGGWPRNWHAVASTILAPVQYRLAEFDVLWEITDDIVAEMLGALETRSPYVDGAIVRGAAHPIMVGPLGDAYNYQVLAFVALCHAAADRPEILTQRRLI
jgi:pimeloyl-ACP methyl ester carboxylesterase